MWWSGLTTADARNAIEMAAGDLTCQVIDDTTCWLPSSSRAAPRSPGATYLLPVYDEYLVAYRNRTAALDPRYSTRRTNLIFGSTIVVNGRVVGTWMSTRSDHETVVTLSPFAPLVGRVRRAVDDAARRYGRFLGQSVRVVTRARKR